MKINREKIGPLNFWVLSRPQFSSIVISQFLALFTKLRPERNDLISRLLPIFTHSRPKSSELLARFLAIFVNLIPETNERFSPIFPNLRAKKLSYCSNFRYSHEIETRKELTYSSSFSYFHEFQSRKNELFPLF